MDWGYTMKLALLGGAAALALTLAACDAGGPATSAKAPPPAPASGSTGVSAAAGPDQAAASAVGGSAGADPRDQPVPLVDGKPMWAANRLHTAEENAAYQFNKNGRDFGAASETDYVARAHAFTQSPPADVQRLQRSNGDSLLYDARTNTFAVVTKTGAPRTMFKPRSGEAYWKEQQDRESASESGDSGGQG
jgi:pyocin large subunit-like protein